MFIEHSLERDFIAIRSAVIEIEYVRTLKITSLHVVKLCTKVRKILQVAKYPAQQVFILLKSIFPKSNVRYTI